MQYRIGQIKITGEKVFNETLIRAVLRLVSGGEFSESLLRNGFDDLKQLYGNRGYINFTPVPVLDFDQQQKVVNLTINIDEDRQFIVDHPDATRKILDCVGLPSRAPPVAPAASNHHAESDWS